MKGVTLRTPTWMQQRRERLVPLQRRIAVIAMVALTALGIVATSVATATSAQATLCLANRCPK